MRVGTFLILKALIIHKVVSFATFKSFAINHVKRNDYPFQSSSQLKLWSSRDDNVFLPLVTSNPTRSILFSISQTTAGALLGPFLDSYHSANGVLQYDLPFSAVLWGSTSIPALTTTWWVPPLFGLAGFLIGWLYIILDDVLKEDNMKAITVPMILIGISLFTFQYWLSGILYVNGVDRSIIFGIMSIFAYFGYSQLDGTKSGLVTSIATAIGGPLIEIGLITSLEGTNGGYHYNDLGETGFFPLWIIPVYFLGGPANGNIARGVWKALGTLFQSDQNSSSNKNSAKKSGCPECKDSRAVPCPNCDGVGYYMTYGREVRCNCCNGRGRVMCRNCFDWYGEDPSDIQSIREFMSRIPD